MASAACGFAAADARADITNVSADGKKVVFISDASNLPGSTGDDQIYVRNLKSGRTELVSRDSNGIPGNGSSEFPSISAHGRKVAFTSGASNLVAGDTNLTSDIFVHSLASDKTKRVSVSSNGSEGNSSSFTPSISATGRRVAFTSTARNLIAGDTNGATDVFLHYLRSDKTRRLSVASDGTAGNAGSFSPSISANGRRVAFESLATNLVGGDNNDASDIFLHSLRSDKTKRLNVSSSGAEADDDGANPSISADGRSVAFNSFATNLVEGDPAFTDVFVHQIPSGETKRVSIHSDGTAGNGASAVPSISADGTRVAFRSLATNLVTGDTNDADDVFVHDLRSEETNRVSVGSDGMQGDDDSDFSSISADGHAVAFESHASNLVGDDTNGASDIFLHNLGSATTERVSVDSNGTQLDRRSCMFFSGCL